MEIGLLSQAWMREEYACLCRSKKRTFSLTGGWIAAILHVIKARMYTGIMLDNTVLMLGLVSK